MGGLDRCVQIHAVHRIIFPLHFCFLSSSIYFFFLVSHLFSLLYAFFLLSSSSIFFPSYDILSSFLQQRTSSVLVFKPKSYSISLHHIFQHNNSRIFSMILLIWVPRFEVGIWNLLELMSKIDMGSVFLGKMGFSIYIFFFKFCQIHSSASSSPLDF